tara:strand:- start:173 stop:1732 length:1560 start_codon:yes stop_codon:yes gene_type:complete
MIKRIIIPGPPGTGKTYRLVNTYLKEEVEVHKTPVKKIGFFTFSKNASEIAKRRAIQFLTKVDWDEDLKYFSTLHALGSRECSIDTNTQLLKGKKWDLFKSYVGGFAERLNFDTFTADDGSIIYGNEYMKLINLARSRKIGLESQYNLQEHLNDISFKDLQYLNECLIKYKKENQMFEFIDMISLFIDKQKCPPLDAVFLDEAQDLNNLQWDMFHYIESKAQRSYIAGDDDQAIMGFQGANSAHFVKLHKESEIDKSLVKSRRVPKSVIKIAKSILEKIPSGERIIKEWQPTDYEGTVSFVSNYEAIDFSKGRWLIQTRTNKMLEPIKDFFEDKGFYYSSKKGNNLITKDLIIAIDSWTKLSEGQLIPAKLARKMYSYMTVTGGRIKRGFGNGKSFKEISEEVVNLEDLHKSHGLQAAGNWQQAFDKPDERRKQYILALQENGEDISPVSRPRIRLSTIHGAKGDEDENIVHFLDLDILSYNEFQRNPHPEHRLQFVGVTRTISNLYIVNPTGPYGYQI